MYTPQSCGESEVQSTSEQEAIQVPADHRPRPRVDYAVCVVALINLYQPSRHSAPVTSVTGRCAGVITASVHDGDRGIMHLPEMVADSRRLRGIGQCGVMIPSREILRLRGVLSFLC